MDVPPNKYHIYGNVVHGDKVAGNKIIAETYVERQVIFKGPAIKDIEQLPPEEGESPYKGLNYFTEEDTEWFFGREAAITKLVDRLHDLDILVIVGASGSGKSSLVRAGVIPVMQRIRTLSNGMEPPTGTWHAYTFTPTARPTARLDGIQKQAQKEIAADNSNDNGDHKLLYFVVG